MKLPVTFLSFSLSVALANPLVIKRSSTSDKATIGYATLSGGTTGGGSAAPVTVTSLSALKAAVASSTSKVLIVSGTITGNEVVKVGSNTSILGKSGATLSGIGLRVLEVSNVIVRNLKLWSSLLAKRTSDHIAIQASNRVWVDSVELWADHDHDQDYYDGLLDITHGAYAISITNSYLHDDWKGSLVGHSDSNESEDVAIQVTYAYNKWYNLNTRAPYIRFGHGHIFNSYYLSINDAITGIAGAQLLVQSNVFESLDISLYTSSDACADATGNLFSGIVDHTPCTLVGSAPYAYSIMPASSVKAYVNANAGAKLSF
ncbi:unnamed protein product [Rhizoctonia solani]|uniref:Pectate lyase domain-containing protein n=1 Tax=Rhizoctonia solani TaxID=456999 RepID=A0A8H2WQ47_9AGAM|nr:unnamed protein product [Rhizoctonia solani]